MTPKHYRFAIVGLGKRGHYHLKNIESLDGVSARCVAVADPRQPTPQERERFGRSFYADYRDLLANERDLDFVLVASLAAQHAEQALAALALGYPVFLEKAVALTWEGAVELYRSVVERHYPLFIGYNLRRFPAVLAMKRILHEGRLGHIQSVLAHVNTGTRWSKNVWEYYSSPPSSDLIVGKLTHDTDTLQHCLGAEAVDCCATITRNVWPERPGSGMNQGDTCSISGLLTHGALYTVHLTTAGPDYERRYVVNGTEGQLEAVIHTQRPERPLASATLWLNGQDPRAVELPAAVGGHGGADVRIHRDFFEWLQTSPDRPDDPRSILTGMVIPTAALDSARTGMRVNCAERLRQAEQGLA